MTPVRFGLRGRCCPRWIEGRDATFVADSDDGQIGPRSTALLCLGRTVVGVPPRGRA